MDCDPGHDDAIAILVASDLCDVAAITTVAGNAPLTHTTANALAIAGLFALTCPVFAGADRPLLVAPRHAPDIHGESGLDGTALPPPTRAVTDTHAVEAIIEITRAQEGTWLVPVGPLTNIALAMRLDPHLVDRIAGISLMGGGIGFGNVTPHGEFNLVFDPHAAAIVFDSGAHLAMSGLDLTHQVMVTPDDEQLLHPADGSPGSARRQFVADVLRVFSTRYQAVRGGPLQGPMHDPCAVLAVTHPELFRADFLEVHVTTEGPHAGMTAADIRGLPGRDTPNVHVQREIDAAAARTTMFDAVNRAIAR